GAVCHPVRLRRCAGGALRRLQLELAGHRLDLHPGQSRRRCGGTAAVAASGSQRLRRGYSGEHGGSVMNTNFILVAAFMVLLLLVLSAISSVAASDIGRRAKVRWIVLMALVQLLGLGIWWLRGPKRS